MKVVMLLSVLAGFFISLQAKQPPIEYLYHTLNRQAIDEDDASNAMFIIREDDRSRIDKDYWYLQSVEALVTVAQSLPTEDQEAGIMIVLMTPKLGSGDSETKRILAEAVRQFKEAKLTLYLSKPDSNSSAEARN